MKRALILLALLPAACGDKPANNASEHVHDHIHSHAGEDHPLPEVMAGPWKIKPTLKGEVKRGDTTVVELRLSGAPTDKVAITGFVETPAGEIVLQTLPYHRMKDEGRYGVHLELPADAPKELVMRLTLTTEQETHEAQFKLP
jgi:hypothetical protein